jgi:hypothetical protein
MTYTIDPAPTHERDGVDELLSGLLDIQDDIAQAVIWMAENWSADLPAPHWYGRGHQRDDDEAVRLLVCCDLAELARVAELVEDIPTDDDTPDGYGARYRRVCYRFGAGHVELHAFAEIDREPER